MIIPTSPKSKDLKVLLVARNKLEIIKLRNDRRCEHKYWKSGLAHRGKTRQGSGHLGVLNNDEVTAFVSDWGLKRVNRQVVIPFILADLQYCAI